MTKTEMMFKNILKDLKSAVDNINSLANNALHDGELNNYAEETYMCNMRRFITLKNLLIDSGFTVTVESGESCRAEKTQKTYQTYKSVIVDGKELIL